MYKITPWHYYNTKFSIDDIKLAPNFCGGDSRDELNLLDAAKVTKKVPPETIVNLVLKSSDTLTQQTLAAFGNDLENLYVLCTSCEISSEFLDKCENLRGLYITYNKNLKTIPSGFFKQSSALRRLVINYAEIILKPGMFAGLESLEDLDLQENNITELKTGVLCNLPKVQKLILARNKITQISPGAFTGICLSQIDLSNNSLKNWSVDYLGSDTNLKYLNLSHNKLDSNSSFNLSQLFHLNLDFNRIEKIDKGMFGESMEKLDYLALNSNKISTIEVDAFNLKLLRVLMLDHNKIQTLPENVFGKLPQLHQLNLDHNNFTTLQIDAFTPLQSLSDLALSCCNLTELSNPTKDGSKSLSNLHLDDNNLTKLSTGVFSGFSGVTILELNECKLETLEDNWCCGLTALKQLNLSGNKLHELKSGAFKDLKTLKTLNLSGNCIAVVEKGAFNELDALSTLNLCDNRLESICEYMFEGLTGLRSLALGNNEITGLNNNSLGVLHNLIYLDLSENRISDIEELAFGHVKNLVTLDLGYNGIKIWPNLTQVCDLGKLVLSCNYLKEFDEKVLDFLTGLTQLYIDDNCIKSIDAALIETSALREFQFDDNKLESDTVQRIQTILQTRQIRRRASVRIEPRMKCRKVIL